MSSIRELTHYYAGVWKRPRVSEYFDVINPGGAAAIKFRYEVPPGNIGINIGVAAPMAYFPFSGWRDSFLGVLHGQGFDARGILHGQKGCGRALAQGMV
jgi:hypothetical protein